MSVMGLLDEAGEVLLDDEGTGLGGRCDGEASRAVVGLHLHLHHQRAEHVDAEGPPALLVLRVAGHRGRDVIVNPMVVLHVVVVPTAAADDAGRI